VVDSNIFVRPEDGPNEWAETCRLNEKRNNNKVTKAIIANIRTYSCVLTVYILKCN